MWQRQALDRCCSADTERAASSAELVKEIARVVVLIISDLEEETMGGKGGEKV